MAAKTSSIPRFLLPQFGPMWRSAVRSAAFGRPLNTDVGQVMVRYVSKTASRRPAIASSAPKISGARAASTRASEKAAKASAPTRLHSKVSSLKPVGSAQESEAFVKSAAPKPTTTPKAADPSKPIVLEKPERFNPPSHGTRLPRSTPRHYGGTMTAEEVQAQSKKTYPGLPPPPDTWSSWFINSRGIHTFITLGTLTALTAFTFITNFKAKSPFADLIPPISEFPRHPFQYIGACIDVVRMHEEHESTQTAEKRRRKVEDAAKREQYRKAHGIDQPVGLFGGKAAVTPGPEPEPESAVSAAVVEASPSEPQSDATVELPPDDKRKKLMGIF